MASQKAPISIPPDGTESINLTSELVQEFIRASERATMAVSPQSKWPEAEIFRKLMERELAPAEAVVQIAAQSIAVAESERLAKGKEKRVLEEAPTTISQHTYAVACCILRYAMNTTPSQQRDLVDFLFLLWKTSVPDLENGDILSLDSDDVWTGLPYVVISWRDYIHNHVPRQVTDHISVDQPTTYENFFGFLAQLSELRFSSFYENTSWCRKTMRGVVERYDEDEAAIQPEGVIRLMSTWLIYAPKKLRANALRSYMENKKDPLRLAEDLRLRVVHAPEGSPLVAYEQERVRELSDVAFYPEYWAKWKKILQHHEHVPTPRDTPNLIRKALESMAEAERADVYLALGSS